MLIVWLTVHFGFCWYKIRTPINQLHMSLYPLYYEGSWMPVESDTATFPLFQLWGESQCPAGVNNSDVKLYTCTSCAVYYCILVTRWQQWGCTCSSFYSRKWFPVRKQENKIGRKYPERHTSALIKSQAEAGLGKCVSDHMWDFVPIPSWKISLTNCSVLFQPGLVV